MIDEKILLNQNSHIDDRLNFLRSQNVPLNENESFVNNHIHTTYSFSPYTPSAAIYYAKKAGLSTAGIMDHDSVGGIDEFIKAGNILNMPVTVGFECRTSVAGTPVEGRRLNNPDQTSVAYVTLHGIPHSQIDKCEKFLAPKRLKRNERNRRMCQNITDVCGISIDFEKDVLPLSSFDKGGSVTERHVLFALTLKIIDGKSRFEVNEILDKLCGSLSEKKKKMLLEAPCEYYAYDVLGILKSSLIKKIYIPADEELIHIKDFISFAKEVGGIAAYAYLGDVGESPTGDKAAQKFEDDYLDLLFESICELGFNAVTYMPSRNTAEQLSKVMALCEKHNLFQISGEDINSPRQSFTCPAMKAYPHLYDATYALIGHEIAATRDINDGMFSEKTVSSMPDLKERISYFANIGRTESQK